MVGLVAEVLVLELLQAAGEQACAGEQDDGERGLQDDEGLLREGGRIFGAAVRAAQGLGGIDVGGEPGWGGAESSEADPFAGVFLP
jgi:hypothetical protein